MKWIPDYSMAASFAAAPLRTLPALVLVTALAGCGGGDGSDAGAAGADEGAPEVGEPAAAAQPARQAGAGGELDYADVCASLDPDALAGLAGATVTRVESRDRSMMDSQIGDCRIFVSASAYLEVSLFGRADDRLMVNKGGGEQVPLADEPRARSIDVAGANRAVVLWANENFESESNNIRAVVVEHGSRALSVTHGGLGPWRTPDILLAVAERAREDLGW